MTVMICPLETNKGKTQRCAAAPPPTTRPSRWASSCSYSPEPRKHLKGSTSDVTYKKYQKWYLEAGSTSSTVYGLDLKSDPLPGAAPVFKRCCSHQQDYRVASQGGGSPVGKPWVNLYEFMVIHDLDRGTPITSETSICS